MNLYTAVGHRLSNYSNLTALVSTRIYANKLPQSVSYPAVSYQVISGIPRTHLMNADDDLTAARVQVSSWDDNITDAMLVADQIKAALQDFSGTMGGDGGLTVQRVFYELGPVDVYDPEIKIHNIVQDFIVWWEEA